MQHQALQQVDADLVKAVGGNVHPDAQKRFLFERCSSLPTPGLLVRGYLDECETCEPELQRAMELELQHKELQNKLLARQIEQLDQAQE